jgi:hypothetical protein
MVKEFVVVLMVDGIGRAILLADVGSFVTYTGAGIRGLGGGGYGDLPRR